MAQLDNEQRLQMLKDAVTGLADLAPHELGPIVDIWMQMQPGLFQDKTAAHLDLQNILQKGQIYLAEKGGDRYANES